jgi:hypothetical protein
VVTLNVVEPLGNDMDVYMNTTLHDHVVGRVEATAGLQMDTQTTVYVDARRLHFFEPGETGMNLTLSGQTQSAVSVPTGAGAGALPVESAHAMA